jgi:type IV secretory pathway VirB3-like protein
MKEHKVFKSLNNPILPLGVTDKYLIFLGFFFILNSFFFYVISLWLIPAIITIILFLYLFGKKKIKQDSRYFLILFKSIKNHGFKKELRYKK